MSLTQWLLLGIGAAIVFGCWLHRNLDAPADQPFRAGFGRFARGAVIVGYAACALLTPLAHLTDVPAAGWGMTIFALGFTLLTPGAFLPMVCYGEGGLTLRSWFGVVHTLRWEDVASVTTADRAIILRTASKQFTFSPFMTGSDAFTQYARLYCRQHSEGR